MTLIPSFPGVSLANDMLPSAGLALLALFRQIRSIGKTLKSFILRCLIFFPHLLRRIWPLCPRASPKDVPKKKGDHAGPSFAGTSDVYKGYSTIHASRDFNRAGEPHFSVRPGSADVLPLSPVAGQWRSQSRPHSPASSTSLSLSGSPRRSDRPLSRSSTRSIASSQNADSPRPLTIRHLNTPLTLTHSRVTSTQFAGVLPNRPRSPSPMPIPLTVSFPSPSQPPFPSRSSPPPPSPHSHPLPQTSTPESSGSTQVSNVIPQASSEGSCPSSFAIRVSPPSRSLTLEHNSQSTSTSPRSPLFVQPGHLSGPSQSPTAESVRPTQDPSDPRGLGLSYLDSTHGTTYNSGVLPAGIPTPSSDQVQYVPSFPQPIVQIPTVDTAGTLPDERTRSIRLMTSEQVSRYVNKGDV